MTTAAVTAAVRAALTVGAVTIEACLAAGASRSGLGRQPAAEDRGDERRDVSLTQRRLRDPDAVIAGLPPDHRPLPDLDRYDELLHRRGTPARQPEGTNA